MPYQLGTRIFKTKPDITKYFQSYHNSHIVGTILEGEHKIVMTDLIKRHPNYDEWDVRGEIEFKLNMDGYGNKNYLMKNGDEWYSFSYIKCIKSGTKENNIKANVNNAAREAIRNQILEFREQHKKNNLFQCDTCCKYFETIDVDHDFSQITFQTLLNKFMNIKKKEFKSFELVETPNGSLFNSIDCDEWCQYHKKHAILRLLCRHCHQNKVKKISSQS